jgi:aspartate racemase
VIPHDAAPASSPPIAWDPATVEHLLQRNEQVPQAVDRVAELLVRRRVWFTLSRNHEARSCRDAAYKRRRLGHEGIPLWDELKSFFGRLPPGPDGAPAYVVAHCRGDRLLAMSRLAAALDLAEPPARLEPQELEGLGMGYGLVNPFEAWSIEPFAMDGRLLASGVLQVFDQDLLVPHGIPGTVMTNAGDLTWAVEFHAPELVRALDNVLVADIADDDPEEPHRPPPIRPTIGILTGNGPESGISLWRRLNERVRELLGDDNLGDISMPRVLLHSLPDLGLSMELPARHEPVWEALSRAADGLLGEGANLVTVACNTTHYFAPQLHELCRARGAEFVSMPEAVAALLRARAVDQVALVGIRPVAELGPWSAYREALAGFDVERPSPSAMSGIGEVAYQVKQDGANEEGLTRLRDILRSEFESQTIVIALTELSLLVERQRKAGRSGKTLIDTLSVYADALAARWLGLPFPLPDHL